MPEIQAQETPQNAAEVDSNCSEFNEIRNKLRTILFFIKEQ